MAANCMGLRPKHEVPWEGGLQFSGTSSDQNLIHADQPPGNNACLMCFVAAFSFFQKDSACVFCLKVLPKQREHAWAV